MTTARLSSTLVKKSTVLWPTVLPLQFMFKQACVQVHFWFTPIQKTISILTR